MGKVIITYSLQHYSAYLLFLVSYMNVGHLANFLLCFPTHLLCYLSHLRELCLETQPDNSICKSRAQVQFIFVFPQLQALGLPRCPSPHTYTHPPHLLQLHTHTHPHTTHTLALTHPHTPSLIHTFTTHPHTTLTHTHTSHLHTHTMLKCQTSSCKKISQTEDSSRKGQTDHYKDGK